MGRRLVCCREAVILSFLCQKACNKTLEACEGFCFVCRWVAFFTGTRRTCMALFEGKTL